MPTQKIFGFTLLVALVSIFVWAVATSGDEPGKRGIEKPAGQRGPGQILYLTYCQSCHGTAGHGNGPAAPSLRTPPTDLTLLWERYGTPLDREKIEEYIDGRRLLDFHGQREMPIWGKEFFPDVPPGTPHLESVKSRLIEVLVQYLETLQTEQRS